MTAVLAGYIGLSALVNAYRAGIGSTTRSRAEAVESAITCSLLAWWVIAHG